MWPDAFSQVFSSDGYERFPKLIKEEPVDVLEGEAWEGWCDDRMDLIILIKEQQRKNIPWYLQ